MKRSLKGLRILNTRPQEQAYKLSESIRDLGGMVIELPALEIQAIDSNWVNLLPELTDVDHAIFISANAVHYCFTQLKARHINWPTSIHITAIGQGSAAALQRFSIKVDAIPEFPDSEHLLSLEPLQHIEKQNVLLFKGNGGRLLVEEQLVQKGANLVILPIYQRIMPKISPLFIQSIWRDDFVDIILLTSEQSLHNLFKLFGKEAHNWLKNKKWLVISERLAHTASALGIYNIKICHPNQVLNTLFDYVNKD